MEQNHRCTGVRQKRTLRARARARNNPWHLENEILSILSILSPAWISDRSRDPSQDSIFWIFWNNRRSADGARTGHRKSEQTGARAHARDYEETDDAHARSERARSDSQIARAAAMMLHSA